MGNEMIEEFRKKGWLKLDMLDKAPVFEVRERLQQKLKELMGQEVSLEDYHKVMKDDEKHHDIQYKMTSFFRENKFGTKIVEKQLDLIRPLIGGDLLVQRSPYLRVARPDQKGDNIGYHRDTYYGASTYEVSFLIPYVDVDKEAALQVMSGSHILGEDEFKFTQVAEEKSGVVKDSEKHQLGFLYAPKVMDDSIAEKMEPVPLKVGEVLIFGLSLVHGCVENKSTKTRWRSDVRLVNTLAPIDFEGMRRAGTDFYDVLCSAPVTSSAQAYLAANEGALV